MTRESGSIDRRAYLKTVSATGALALTSTAGCLGLGGGGGGEITAGTAPGFPPFEMKEGGELVGFDIDLLEAVVAETDYELAGWNEFEFSSLEPALQNDKIDVIAAAMTINPDRDETIDFSDPYYSANQAIVVADGSGFSPSTLEDLTDRTLGAQKGTTGEEVVRTQLIETGMVSQGDYNSYDNYVLAIEDLINGNIDAVVLDTPTANTFAEERPVSIAFTHETGEQYGLGIREDDDDLQAALNEGLQAIRDAGTYDELLDKWGLAADT